MISKRIQILAIGVELLFSLELVGMVFSACEPLPHPTVEVTKVIPATVVVTQVVTQNVVATPLPATPAPTAIPATPTPAGLEVDQKGLFVWCWPRNAVMPEGEQNPASIPAGALPGQKVGDVIQVTSQVHSCTFVYTFNQSMPAGTLLEVYNPDGTTPIYKTALSPVSQTPKQGVFFTQNPAFVDPPFWEIEYRFVIRSAEGKELRSDTIDFKRAWTGEACYAGKQRDPVTLKCPSLEESHPWDPWHGWNQDGKVED